MTVHVSVITLGHTAPLSNTFTQNIKKKQFQECTFVAIFNTPVLANITV
jgi:hypothetical protein